MVRIGNAGTGLEKDYYASGERNVINFHLVNNVM